MTPVECEHESALLGTQACQAGLPISLRATKSDGEGTPEKGAKDARRHDHKMKPEGAGAGELLPEWGCPAPEIDRRQKNGPSRSGDADGTTTCQAVSVYPSRPGAE